MNTHILEYLTITLGIKPPVLRIPSPTPISAPINNTPLNLDILNSKLEMLLNTGINNNITSNHISGPLDQFNVTSLLSLKLDILGKFYLAITNISLYLALVLTVIIGIFYLGNNDSKLVPNK
jgi:hypothetical protein